METEKANQKIKGQGKTTRLPSLHYLPLKKKEVKRKMAGIIIAGGKRVNLETAEVLYTDGRFRGSRGVKLYRTEKGTLVWENWTNWQGEDDTYVIVTPEEAFKRLCQCRHPERVASAVEKLGIEIPEG